MTSKKSLDELAAEFADKVKGVHAEEQQRAQSAKAAAEAARIAAEAKRARIDDALQTFVDNVSKATNKIQRQFQKRDLSCHAANIYVNRKDKNHNPDAFMFYTSDGRAAETLYTFMFQNVEIAFASCIGSEGQHDSIVGYYGPALGNRHNKRGEHTKFFDKPTLATDTSETHVGSIVAEAFQALTK